MPATASIHGAMVIALPPTNTTTVGVPSAAAARISSSWRPGNPRKARSRNSPSSMPATTIAVSLERASCTASSIRAAPSSTPPASQISFSRALPVLSKYSIRISCDVPGER